MTEVQRSIISMFESIYSVQEHPALATKIALFGTRLRMSASSEDICKNRPSVMQKQPLDVWQPKIAPLFFIGPFLGFRNP